MVGLFASAIADSAQVGNATQARARRGGVVRGAASDAFSRTSTYAGCLEC